MLLTLTRPGAVSPDTLAVDHTGLQYASVRVKTSASDSVSLHVQTATDPQGVDIPLRVFRPQVRLLVQPPIIAALGLATAGLSVVLPPGTGAETVTVRLAAEEGLVSPKTLGATVDGENAATIRSTRPGRFHVTAFVDGIPADTQSIAFVWPLSFAVATLCGVVLSGLGKFVGAKKPTPRRFLLDVLRGLPFGIIAAAAGAIGVDLVGLKLTDAVAATSVAVMLTAAFGAWGGRRIMKV
jgi:energy-converting hydrogenase Eha subunit A